MANKKEATQAIAIDDEIEAQENSNKRSRKSGNHRFRSSDEADVFDNSDDYMEEPESKPKPKSKSKSKNSSNKSKSSSKKSKGQTKSGSKKPKVEEPAEEIEYEDFSDDELGTLVLIEKELKELGIEYSKDNLIYLINSLEEELVDEDYVIVPETISKVLDVVEKNEMDFPQITSISPLTFSVVNK